MDSVAEAVGSPIDKYGQTWPRLTVSDYGTLEVKFRTDRVKSTKATLDGLGDTVSARERAEMLVSSTSSPVTIGMVDVWLCTHAGATEALRLSLKRAGVSTLTAQDEAVSLIPNMDYACSLARVLIGFAREQSPEELAEAAARAAGGKFVKKGDDAEADPS